MLAAGEEIPSTRALSLKLGVNPMTVSKAYGLLEEERLIEHRPGLPLVVRAARVIVPRHLRKSRAGQRLELVQIDQVHELRLPRGYFACTVNTCDQLCVLPFG